MCDRDITLRYIDKHIVRYIYDGDLYLLTADKASINAQNIKTLRALLAQLKYSPCPPY